MSKLLDRRFLILMSFLLMCCVSFSAITGAKYLSQLIGLVPASVSLGANWKKYASIYNTSSIFFQFQKVTIQYI